VLPVDLDVKDLASEKQDETFFGNCSQLRASKAFRQNVYICFNHDSHGAIFMDLDQQLYLLVVSDLPVTTQDDLDSGFRELLVSADKVREGMDRDAFILKSDNMEQIGYVFRIPEKAEESFAADLFHELFKVKLKTQDIRYKWD